MNIIDITFTIKSYTILKNNWKIFNNFNKSKLLSLIIIINIKYKLEFVIWY